MKLGVFVEVISRKFLATYKKFVFNIGNREPLKDFNWERRTQIRSAI